MDIHGDYLFNLPNLYLWLLLCVIFYLTIVWGSTTPKLASTVNWDSGLIVPLQGDPEFFTSHEHWRLHLGPGTRKEWAYVDTEGTADTPQNDMEKFILGIRLALTGAASNRATKPLEAANNGFSFLKRIQASDGYWLGFCGGQMYLLPTYIITLYLCGTQVLHEQRLEMMRYILYHAHPEDGGWGLHCEDSSTVFGTCMNYVALRILGMDPQHSTMVKARNTLHRLGGAVSCPTWGKFWLSLLNVYDWEGVNPIPPEIWLLPEWAPIHPSKWWIFMRAFYTPMSYLYRVRFRARITDFTLELRRELYIQPYSSVNWPSKRNFIASVDNLVPHSIFLDVFYMILGSTLETWSFISLSRRALNKVYELIRYEDENTGYHDLGSPSKLLQMLCRAHAEGPDSEAVKQHILRLKEYIWMGPDGMQIMVQTGCQVWDTALIAHALFESGLSNMAENQESILRILSFLDKEQMIENPLHYPMDYRQATKGGWAFATRREGGYIASDCTSEALNVILIFSHKLEQEHRIPEGRLQDAVDLLISMQASDGGYPSFECVRGSQLLELLNPGELYDKMMVEYSYPECTVSVINALLEFKKQYEYRAHEIDAVVNRAVHYIRNAQLDHGGWYGSWGICFTYGTWFALQGLAMVGEYYSNSLRVQKACHFLLSNQKDDGGWGESSKSCQTETYVQHEHMTMAQTSWAAMALIHARYPNKKPVECAVRKVMSMQLEDGSWAPEAATGMGLRSGVLPYPLYRLTFPIWMLGMAHRYLDNKT